jgi:hypothetical protein
MNKSIIKRILSYIGIIVLFIVIAYSFVPQVLGGKIVNQSDISGYVGMSNEMTQYNKTHPDDKTEWTNSMFSGMPSISISAPHEGDWTQWLYDFLLTGKRPATYLFISLLGAFLLMLSLGIDKLLAIGGAIAITFCSYNLQIIQVGHNTKMQAIAFLPWALAAFIFTYRAALSNKKSDKDGKSGISRGKWIPGTLLGSVLFALTLSFQIKANHQQITYYLAILIFLYAIVLLIWIVTGRERRGLLGRFFAASAMLLIIGCIGIAANANKLVPLYQYTGYTMRGGSELSGSSNTHPDKTGDISKREGLDLSYATNWSYGWQELPNMLIPDFNGGSSAGAVNPRKSETYKLLKQAGQTNLREISKNLPLYWGPQPFTAGPMYMGAISIFLFILGLFLYKGKEKWWLVLATLTAVFLALGSHFMWFTRFWFDYMPFYNKFRTVSMALVILQYTLPMLGFIVLDRILKGEYSRKEFKKSGFSAFAITAGFCLICAVLPGVAGGFTGDSDTQMQDVLVKALQADRRSLLVGDAWTSFIFVSLAYLLILWAYSVPASAKVSYASDPHIRNARRTEAGIGIIVLILINMFTVGKRYLNKDDFITPRDFSGQFTERAVDKMILKDPAPDYRVADLTVNVFNDSHPSYWHKNIGGYSPAKIQRYQDLIDRYLVPELNSVYSSIKSVKTAEELNAALPDLPVMSMLNCKYVIVGADIPAAVNKNAFGNAWFTNSLIKAGTPDDEIRLLGEVNLRETAVVGHDFESAYADIVTSNKSVSAEDTIYMTSYAPNELHYHYKISSERTAVFSEIYYPDGWHAKMNDATDKSDLSLFRSDWVLRGAVLPAGEHDIVMRFDPESYTLGRTISKASSITLLILVLLCSGGMWAQGSFVKTKP